MSGQVRQECWTTGSGHAGKASCKAGSCRRDQLLGRVMVKKADLGSVLVRLDMTID